MVGFTFTDKAFEVIKTYHALQKFGILFVRDIQLQISTQDIYSEDNKPSNLINKMVYSAVSTYLYTYKSRTTQEEDSNLCTFYTYSCQFAHLFQHAELQSMLSGESQVVLLILQFGTFSCYRV